MKASEVKSTLGKIQAGKVNQALRDVRWLGSAHRELSNRLENGEVVESSCRIHSLFGPSTDFTGKVNGEIDKVFESFPVLTAGNYKAAISALETLGADLEKQIPIDDKRKSLEVLQVEAKERANRQEKDKQATAIKDAVEEKGRVLFESKKPSWAKAVIVAYQEFDNCDSMTDYFATKSGPAFLIGWSPHTKDVFSEMRRAAGACDLQEVHHLAVAPDVNSNGCKKTSDNAKWWHPADEHREKYSMGAGYYLKASHRYDTGWKVEKERLSGRMSSIYGVCGRDDGYRIPENSRAGSGTSPSDVEVDGAAVSENKEKGGLEIRFPEKPARDVLDTLKAHGWRWSRFNHCWYMKKSDQALAFANQLTAK